MSPRNSDRAARPDGDADVLADWPEQAGTIPAVVDGAVISAAWVDPHAATKVLGLDLRPADELDRVFRIVKTAPANDLVDQGQCAAVLWQPDEALEPGGARPAHVHLAWNGSRLVPHLDRTPGARRSPLTTSMHAVVLAGLCQDGEARTHALHTARILTDAGLIGSDAVAKVMPALLVCPDVSPAKMVTAIEKEPRTLPALWPVITESIRFAAHAEPLPRWLNRVLDVAAAVLPQLIAAAGHGWIPEEAAQLTGIRDIAARHGRQAALVKARALAQRTDW